METKSRYEVIADLEESKRNLLKERSTLDLQVEAKKREIKQLERNLEDKREDLVSFTKSLDERRNSYNILIESIDNSLKRMSEISQTPRK